MLTMDLTSCRKKWSKTNYFFKETAFLRVFTAFLSQPENECEDENDNEPESLD